MTSTENCRSGEFTEGESSASPFHWFHSYLPAETDLTVWEYYLPVPRMNTLLVLLTVPEEEGFRLEKDDDHDC